MPNSLQNTILRQFTGNINARFKRAVNEFRKSKQNTNDANGKEEVGKLSSLPGMALESKIRSEAIGACTW